MTDSTLHSGSPFDPPQIYETAIADNSHETSKIPPWGIGDLPKPKPLGLQNLHFFGVSVDVVSDEQEPLRLLSRDAVPNRSRLILLATGAEGDPGDGLFGGKRSCREKATRNKQSGEPGSR